MLSPGTYWDVTEITLERRYMAGKPDTVVIPCESLLVEPGQYVTEIAAGGSQQRTEIAEASLLARGVDLGDLPHFRCSRGGRRLDTFDKLKR